jgi:hypothetical protein
MRVFLAFSFRDEDKLLVRRVQQLLESLSTLVITGERLGGEQLTEAVKARIRDCDALVGLLTRRDPLANGGWTTHEWVKQEIQHARDNGKRAIALVEDGVKVEGMAAPHEHIPIQRQDLLDPMLILAENVALWRRELGRTVKVQILPPELAQRVGGDGAGIKCRHRLWRNGKFTEWKEAVPQPEVGGTFVYIENVQEDQMLQVSIQEPNKTWQSVATPQWLSIQLA